MPLKSKEERIAYQQAYREANREYLREMRRKRREEMTEEQKEIRRAQKREWYRRKCGGLTKKRTAKAAAPEEPIKQGKPSPKPMSLELRTQRIMEKDAEAHALLSEYKKRAYEALYANQNPYV